jgi:hypothetical protein
VIVVPCHFFCPTVSCNDGSPLAPCTMGQGEGCETASTHSAGAGPAVSRSVMVQLAAFGFLQLMWGFKRGKMSRCAHLVGSEGWFESAYHTALWKHMVGTATGSLKVWPVSFLSCEIWRVLEESDLFPQSVLSLGQQLYASFTFSSLCIGQCLPPGAVVLFLSFSVSLEGP